MDGFNKKYFFGSPFISKLSKYKKQLEILRKLQITNTKSTTKSLDNPNTDKPEKLISNHKYELEQSKTTPNLLLEKAESTNVQKDFAIIASAKDNDSENQILNTAALYEEKEIIENRKRRKQEEIDAKIANAERVKAKSQDRQKNELDKAKQESLKMQQFLNDFVKSVKSEKGQKILP